MSNLPDALPGLIGIGIRAGFVVRGQTRVVELLKKDKAGLVIVCEDIGISTKNELLKYCNLNGILLVSMGSEKEWKEKLKISEKVLGCKRNSFCNQIKKILGV